MSPENSPPPPKNPMYRELEQFKKPIVTTIDYGKANVGQTSDGSDSVAGKVHRSLAYSKTHRHKWRKILELRPPCSKNPTNI